MVVKADILFAKGTRKMLKIHYFASLREQMGRDCDDLVLPDNVSNVAELIDFIKQSDAIFKDVFATTPRILVSVNQVVVSRDCRLAEDDEIAFFPPMTGG